MPKPASHILPPESEPMVYRVPIPVTAVRVYSSDPSSSAYPQCPHCKQPMTREYQAFCENCGQALSWRGFSKAVVILVPASPNPAE